MAKLKNYALSHKNVWKDWLLDSFISKKFCINKTQLVQYSF